MEGMTRASCFRGASPELHQAAHSLRRNMTEAEQVLWQALKGKQLGDLRFRAQHSVDQFILDFYCVACKLVVVVDGGIHDAQAEQDAARTEYLQVLGCRVIRFRNEEVLTDLPAVKDAILRAAHPSDSPRTGG